MCGLKVRFSQSSERRSVFNYALHVEVLSATGMPKKIFVYHQSPAGVEGNTFAEFDHVATPVDFQEIPEDAASETVPWYRTDKVVVWFRNVADLDLAKQMFVDDIAALQKTYDVLTSENNFVRQSDIEFTENGVHEEWVPDEEDSIARDIQTMKTDIQGKLSKNALDGVEFETNDAAGLREAVKTLGNALGATIVKSIAVVFGLFALSAHGAGFSGVHYGQMDLDENPVVVTNVTFDGLITDTDMSSFTQSVARIERDLAEKADNSTLDAALANYLPLRGGVMTGSLYINGDRESGNSLWLWGDSFDGFVLAEGGRPSLQSSEMGHATLSDIVAVANGQSAHCATSGIILDDLETYGRSIFFRSRAFGMRDGDSLKVITLHTSSSIANTVNSFVYARLLKYDSASSVTAVAVSEGRFISTMDKDVPFIFLSEPVLDGGSQYYSVELTTDSSMLPGRSVLRKIFLRVYNNGDGVQHPDCYVRDGLLIPVMSVRYRGGGSPVIMNADNSIGNGTTTYHTGSTLAIQGEFTVMTNGTVTVQTWDQLRLASGQTLPEFIAEAIVAAHGNVYLNALDFDPSSTNELNKVNVEAVYMDAAAISNAVKAVKGASAER